MTEQENSSDGIAETLRTAALVESTAKKPTPLSDVTEEERPALRQKCAPATTSIPTERHKHAAKKLSSNPKPKKRRDVSPARVQMSMETDLKMDEIVVMSAPIQQPIAVLRKSASPIAPVPERSDEKDDTDSITSEIKELRNADTVKGIPEWSDEEEAGGLPRSESRSSRASRVSRAVRQWFCCGLQIEAPSEDNVSSARNEIYNSGI